MRNDSFHFQLLTKVSVRMSSSNPQLYRPPSYISVTGKTTFHYFLYGKLKFLRKIEKSMWWLTFPRNETQWGPTDLRLEPQRSRRSVQDLQEELLETANHQELILHHLRFSFSLLRAHKPCFSVHKLNKIYKFAIIKHIAR